MIPAVEAYLAVRRAAGFTLSNTDYLLRSFARFAAARQDPFIRTATVIAWASESGSVAQRHTRYQTVCRFADFARLEEPRHEAPPPNHFGYRKTRRLPHIYSRGEIDRLLLAATQLPPPDSLRAHTYATLIGLLVATGLRISEALGLLVSDITPNGLLIRKTKFQKTRLVPLHETTAAALRRYLMRRRRMPSGAEHVFIATSGEPLAYPAVHHLLPARGRPPRLHDIRHTFAVRALEASPGGRQRIGQHMVALATYLGHVNIDTTYWYLETTPELLGEIAAAGERFLWGGRP